MAARKYIRVGVVKTTYNIPFKHDDSLKSDNPHVYLEICALPLS